PPASAAPPSTPPRARSAYLFSNGSQAGARLAFGLLAEGFKVAIATQPLRADARSYPRGTFVVRTQRNAATLHDRIAELARRAGVAVVAVQSAYPDTIAPGVGSDDVVSLHAPRIVVAAGEGVDATAKPDTTVPGREPPVLSPTSPAKDKPEWLPGSIFRATLDPTHWLTLGYESDRLPVYVEGSTFWKLSKNGANPVAFVGD